MFRGAWKDLVLKYGADSISLEEEHCVRYKTHVIFMNIGYRLGILFFSAVLIWNTFLLGDVGKVGF